MSFGESTEESTQWVFRGKHAPEIANKVFATVFCDLCGNIHVDYLEKGQMLSGEYYAIIWNSFKHILPALFGEENNSVPPG